MQPIGEPNRIKAPAGDGPRPQTSDGRHSSEVSIRFAGARDRSGGGSTPPHGVVVASASPVVEDAGSVSSKRV